MNSWWVLLVNIVGIASAILIKVWDKLKIWPFTPESVKEQSQYEILHPFKVLALLLSSHNQKTLRLEKIIPSDYVPGTLQMKVLNQKTFFDEPLIGNVSERGILCGSNLTISKKNPLHLEIRNVSNLRQSIWLTFLYKGMGEFSIEKYE